MSLSQDNPLGILPSVDAVLQHLTARERLDGIPHRLLTDAIREAVQHYRRQLAASALPAMTDRDELTRTIAKRAERLAREAARPYYRKAINATGIILHTGLGRAVLPPVALQRLVQELAGYSILQIDPEDGKRSRRDVRIEWLIRKLTCAEAATVVNNNAAATMIVLNTIAHGREVIVSRGQLVEIGGSFRLPEVMALSGAKLVEVGTTNKTHARDYEQAITENTAAILRVHPSNYHIQGFTAEVPLERLVEIAHARGLPLIDDVGAGSLMDYRRLGWPEEPTLPDSIQAGADLVLSSTDKLIGGPQGGLILGKKDLIERIRKNPLARALRVDKLTLSLLESTLLQFLDENVALREIPTLALMRRTVAEVREQAERIANGMRRACPHVGIEIIDGFSQMGSGSLPGQDLPTVLVALDPPAGADELARRLRESTPAVVARIAKDRVLLDPRTVLPGEEPVLIDVVVNALKQK